MTDTEFLTAALAAQRRMTLLTSRALDHERALREDAERGEKKDVDTPITTA